MELRHLRYFMAVAQAGNLTRAARALGIQQPPLTQQIRQLEQEVGHALFRRLPRGVELTPGGEIFRGEVQEILARVDRAVERSRQAVLGITGSISVGLTSSAGLHALTPSLLRGFRDAHPAIEIAYVEGNAPALSEAVGAGRLDVALVRRPVSHLSGLQYHRIANEALLAVLPIGHPAVRLARPSGEPRVRLRDLSGESFVFVSRSGAAGMFGDLVDACRRLGFAPRIGAEVSQMLTNITLVASGFGVSVVPASMRGIHSRSVLYARIVDAPELAAPLNLLCRIDATNPSASRFVAFARALAAAARAPAPSRPASAATRAAASPRPTPRSRAPARRS